MTSEIDLALALIEQDAGREVAINASRILVMYLKRAGANRSTAHCSIHNPIETASLTLNNDGIAEHLKSDLRIEALAERVHMINGGAMVYGHESERRFARSCEDSLKEKIDRGVSALDDALLADAELDREGTRVTAAKV